MSSELLRSLALAGPTGLPPLAAVALAAPPRRIAEDLIRAEGRGDDHECEESSASKSIVIHAK